MHRIIENGLEDYLDGRSDQAFDAHLGDCAECRKQVAEMREVSGMLGSLRTAVAMEPPLGFQARVLREVAGQKAGSLWGVFRIDPGFARKLAFGSLLGLGVMGGYLFTGTADSMAQADHTPEAVMASHDAAAIDQQQHLNGMLVTLASYHQ